MTKLFNAVQCLECGAKWEADFFARRCPVCGSPWLDARYALDTLAQTWRAELPKRPTTLWRYRELLPIPSDAPPVSMNEGWTPLTRAENLERELHHPQLWIKDERRQPTGSFKDRQATIAVTALQAQGVKELVLASTGNAAAAYAAYCARAGIKLWVFLTSSVPVEKMRELALYGAEVVKITGTYDQAKDIAADFAARHHVLLDGGAKAIPSKDSMKTLAYEIAEQLGIALHKGQTWQAPDWYIQAVSGGIGPLGVLKGFEELLAAGLIDRVPKIAVVQTSGCAPMVQAWEQHLEEARPVQPDSLITVLATGRPGPAYRFLRQGLLRYGGTMLAVSDGEAFRAMRRLARSEGFSMEPAASVAFAGLFRLLEQNIITPQECIVVNCSGHTFSAEKHTLEDRYLLSLEATADADHPPVEGLWTALAQLDEQITTVVVIEDNPHDNRLLRRLLQSYKNYRIYDAYTGTDGLDLVRQRHPDLVLLDLTLPDMNGLSVLTELKSDERTRDIPVMVISARTLDDAEETYLRKFSDSVWQKGSFSARDLVAHVTELLDDNATELRHVVTEPPGKTPQPELGDQRPEFGRQRRARILVVEDNVWEARLMRRLFESRPWIEVLEAYSAADALTRVAETPPDLILLDLYLPEETGEEVIVQLQGAETHKIPLIIISGKELEPALYAHLATLAESIWDKTTLDRSHLLAHVENLLAAA
ncbi:MAG TPA: pyridoxal-phosphate dependent enzyme [Anaerolineae bacterium]|nr:pyridoxal-phosphate dependent enzyme [Anaerolineae bacterium]